jgi:hypothetical protein
LINNCNRDHNHIPDYYKIYSRKDSISESVLQNLKTILNSISDDIILRPISHSNCKCENKSYNKGSNDQNEGLSCKHLRNKALLNIDLNRFHGVWYPLLLNTPGQRCIRVEDNRKALSDPSNKDEYWYDIIDEKGIQGYGMICPNLLSNNFTSLRKKT